MTEQEIYFGCTSCELGVSEFWEDFVSKDADNQTIKGRRRSRHWRKIEVKHNEVPLVGQSILFKDCPRKDCGEGTLVRVEKLTLVKA
jgi:hypothetical protein